jgi:hypothetical protein
VPMILSAISSSRAAFIGHTFESLFQSFRNLTVKFGSLLCKNHRKNHAIKQVHDKAKLQNCSP